MVDEKKVKDWLEFDRVNQVVKIKHGLPVGHPFGGNSSILIDIINIILQALTKTRRTTSMPKNTSESS